MLLLEYGADINAISKAGATPLTTAITYNSHKVLQLLLGRCVSPRLQGPHLLSTISLFADVETLKIITATDNLQLKYDKDSLSGYACQLLGRFDVSEELNTYFQDLITVVSENPKTTYHRDSLLDAGLLVGNIPMSEKLGQV